MILIPTDRNFVRKFVIVWAILSVIGVASIFGSSYYMAKELSESMYANFYNHIVVGDWRSLFHGLETSKALFSAVSFESGSSSERFQIGELSSLGFKFEYQDKRTLTKLIFQFSFSRLYTQILILLTCAGFLAVFLSAIWYRKERRDIKNGLLRVGLVETAKQAAKVAHDMRSPLSVLSLLQGVPDKNDPKVMTLYSTSYARLKDISSKLLESSKKSLKMSDTSSNEIFISSFEAVELTTSILNLVDEKILEFDLSERQIVLQIGTIQGKFYGDVAEIVRVISNLINNSVEAAIEQGMGIQDVEIKINGFVSGHMHLEINDNGPGLSPRQIEGVGSLGFSTKGTLGNGLGIYFAKLYLQDIGGSFSIGNSRDGGCTAKITIMRSKEYG